MDDLTPLRNAAQLVRDADRLLLLSVAAERSGGASWQRVAAALGMSRQAAHKRFARRVTELELGVELAQSHVDRVANLVARATDARLDAIEAMTPRREQGR